MKKTVCYGLLALTLALGLTLTTCDNGNSPNGGGGGNNNGGGDNGGGDNGGGFVAVTNISGIPESDIAGKALTLNGTVEPSEATNQTIMWSVASAGTTGARITNGNILDTTGEGTATVRATIANGTTAQGTAYTQNFEITFTDSSGMVWTLVEDTQFNPIIPLESIQSITYANGIWIAVGCELIRARIAYSSDNGETWERADTISNDFGYGIKRQAAYGKGRWVAGGGYGSLGYSDDNGASWNYVAINSDTNPFGAGNDIGRVSYGNNRWLAQDSDKLAYSDSGATWIEVTSHPFNFSIDRLVYGNGRWIARGIQLLSGAFAYIYMHTPLTAKHGHQ